MFYVDIPNPVSDEPMINIASFDTREEAIQFAKDIFGADDKGRVQLVSYVQDDDDEDSQDNPLCLGTNANNLPDCSCGEIYRRVSS